MRPRFIHQSAATSEKKTDKSSKNSVRVHYVSRVKILHRPRLDEGQKAKPGRATRTRPGAAAPGLSLARRLAAARQRPSATETG
ncbi:hypothetical protein IJJ12_00900, partial [bacterium]|nr:hypothetical protein [bacterium]